MRELPRRTPATAPWQLWGAFAQIARRKLPEACYPGVDGFSSAPSPVKIGFVSLGCPKNLVDTEVMMGQLAERGHELTSEPGDAEVLVVNTCSFIDPANKKSIDTILEMAQYKKTGSARRLIVTG